jgi:hypothetical protein
VTLLQRFLTVDDNKNFKEKNIIFADSVFPRLFPLTVKEGSIQRAFSEPGFAVLTQSAATRYFGNESGHRQKNPLRRTHRPAGRSHRSGRSIQYTFALSGADILSFHDPPAHREFPSRSMGMHANGFAYIGLPGQGQVNRTRPSSAPSQTSTSTTQKQRRRGSLPFATLTRHPL